MNSTLKPVLTAGVPQGGQASPAKANVAGVNHAGHPQGAQNHHAGHPQTVQNHHAAASAAAHAAQPSLAPVSANMAQMAQNMSHHGNLSHIGTNSVAPTNTAPSPSKSVGAPLSLVQDKPTPSQPLALTRTPDKKEPEAAVAQANGTIDSPKTVPNAPTPVKPQNPELNKDKPDIAKTSPSTPKPPEKQPNTPQKAETSNVEAAEPVQPKVVTATEPPEKSPAKPTTADVAPTQTEAKPAPESAKEQSKPENKPLAVPKPPEDPKPMGEDKVDAKIEEAKVPKKPETHMPVMVNDKEPDKPPEIIKREEKAPELVKEKPVEVKTPIVKPSEGKPKSTLKLATVTAPVRKRRQTSPSKDVGGAAKKPAEAVSTPDSRTKRNRTQVQLYQSPTPELTMATKLSASAGRSTPTKHQDDKLIVFYKNEYLAVRNAEGTFYVCQCMQNVYRTTRKIKIRWLSQDKSSDPSGETYKPDFYDVTDMECVLTTLSLSRSPEGGGAQILKAEEASRASSILQRALQHEKGQQDNEQLTAEHPDGLDLSLFTDESQLDKKSRKRSGSKSSPLTKPEPELSDSPRAKRARSTPKRSPKSERKPKTLAKIQNAKRKPVGSPPTSKTATVPEKVTPVPVKSPRMAKKAAKTKPEMPVVPPPKGKTPKRITRESKPSPIVPTPSTSTGKTTRTPRKPPAHK